MTEAYPDVPAEEHWKLRFTARALADLGVPRDTAPDNIPQIREKASCPEIVDLFADHYERTRETPSAGHVSNVGGSVHKLSYAGPNRGCVLVQHAQKVVWFLGFTDEHDYKLFEERHRDDKLWPSDEDLALLIRDQRAEAFRSKVQAGARELLVNALASPETPQRGRVGGLLKLDVSVVVVPIDGEDYADIYVAIKMPPEPGAEQTPGWPGGELAADVFDAMGVAGEEITAPVQLPDGPGQIRGVDYANEQVWAVSMVPAKRLPRLRSK